MVCNCLFSSSHYQILYCALFCCGIVYEILELKRLHTHDTLFEKQPCYKVVASRLIFLTKKGGRTKSGGLRPCADRSGAEKVLMNMYEVLNLLFLGGTFLIALLAYIDSRINKRTVGNTPCVFPTVSRYSSRSRASSDFDSLYA